MARYDYRCAGCGRVFEVEHGMSEHPDVACPVCGGRAERVFNASGIVLSGSGFYNTDQRDAGKKPAVAETASSGGDASKPEKGKGKKGETPKASSSTSSPAAKDASSA